MATDSENGKSTSVDEDSGSNLSSSEKKKTFRDICRNSSTFLLSIIFIAYCMDYSLDTSVVPVVPNLVLSTIYPNVNATVVARNKLLKKLLEECNSHENQSVVQVKMLQDKKLINVNCDKVEIVGKKYINQWNFIEKDLVVKSSWILASKLLAEICVDPFVSYFVNRYGTSLILLIGFFTIFISSAVFMFAGFYWLYIASRMLQGVGSGIITIAGLASIAEIYPTDDGRNQAISTVFMGGGMALTVSPIYSAFTYQYIAPWMAFLLPTLFAFIGLGMQLIVYKPHTSSSVYLESVGFIDLLRDKYVVIAALLYFITVMNRARVASTMATIILTISEGSIDDNIWKQGVAIIPFIVGYILANIFMKKLGFGIGRWKMAIIGLFVSAVGVVVEQWLHYWFLGLCSAYLVNGVGIAIVESSSVPMLAYLVEIRHKSSYGKVFTIVDMVLCVGFIVGPLLTSTLIKLFGYTCTYITFLVLLLLYIPFVFFLRDPPHREIKPDEKTKLRSKAGDKEDLINSGSLDE